MSAQPRDLRHVVSDAPHVMVVDSSKLVRKLIGDVLAKDLPNANVTGCDTLSAAREALSKQHFDLVTTSLVLNDGDGLAVADAVRAADTQAYVPVIVVSSEVQSRLEARTLGEEVTDYFDKALGYGALSAFIRGYVHPQPMPGKRILYVEDSRVVAVATKRMLQSQQLEVTHVASAEDAIAWLDTHTRMEDAPGCDLVLTDLYLTGALTGKDVLRHVRETLAHSKRQMPVLVMTGDENGGNQRELIQLGANDLVLKPIEERLLITKTLFQLRVAAMPERAAEAH